MALELLVRNVDFYAYRNCADNWVPFPPGATTGYHGWCGTGQQYFESIIILDSFVYDHVADRYRFITWNNMANYPSWVITTSIIHPETGVEESRQDLTGFAVAHAWTDPMYNGGLNKLYAGYLVPNYRIVEVLLPDGIPTTTMIDNPFVTATQIPILQGTNHGFAICPERKLITIQSLMANEGISVYDYSAYPAAATRLYHHPFPESFGWGMGYEDDQRCWGIFASTQAGFASDRQSVLKYNFVTNRIELLTELQNIGGPDRFAQIAWDTRRKKLGAVRIKADGSDGKHNNAFEIYAPRPAIVQVTVPVNIEPLTVDTKVTFISHVLGSKAEAGGAKEVEISCSPTAALVTTPKKVTQANGAVEFEIEPTTEDATETLTVSYTETKVTS